MEQQYNNEIKELIEIIHKLEKRIDDLEFKNEILEFKVWNLKQMRTLDKVNSDQSDISLDLKLSDIRDDVRKLKRDKKKGILSWFK